MTPTGTLQVAVFGATGKIGRHVIDQLLAAGHTVTAYARNPTKLTTTHPNLTVIQGGLDDPAGIGRAVAGADAVISALGPSLRRGARPAPRSPTAPARSSPRGTPPGPAASSGSPPPASPTPGTGPPSKASYSPCWPGWPSPTPSPSSTA
jgi:uncharacterized protein YbjT (DUF2867 family)